MNALELLNGNIAMWVIVGIICGVIIHLADDKDSKGGVVLSAIFGVQGAVMSGFFYSLFFAQQTLGFDFASFLIAIIGGLFVAFAQRLLLRKEYDSKERLYYEPWFSPFFSDLAGQKGGLSSQVQSGQANREDNNAELTQNEENLDNQTVNDPTSNGIKKEEKEEENIRWF